MSDKENIKDESEENEEERIKHQRNEFVKKYFSIRAEMEKLEEESILYEAQRDRFVSQFTPGILALAVDFYPKYVNIIPVVHYLLEDYGEFLFDEVANLCEHYKDEKAGYFRPLYEANFNIVTRYDIFKKKMDSAKYYEFIEHLKKCFEEEYVENFYFGCFRKHIHLLLKRLFPDYIPEIYDLPAQGFRDLDSFLFVAMLEINEIINEAEPIETV